MVSTGLHFSILSLADSISSSSRLISPLKNVRGAQLPLQSQAELLQGEALSSLILHQPSCRVEGPAQPSSRGMWMGLYLTIWYHN